MAEDEAELKRFERALARKSGQTGSNIKKYGGASTEKLPVPTQPVYRAPVVLPNETRGSNTPKVIRKSEEGGGNVVAPKAEAAAEEKIDTLERKRRERAARRAAEAEALRLEEEKAQASIERRKKEREEKRKAREAGN